MRRSPIKRSRALRHRYRKPSEKERARAWRDAVMRSTGGLSVVSGETAHECHHVIAKGFLRQRGLSEHVWDARNGVPLTRREHARHTSRLESIPLGCLPEQVFDFAAAHGLEWYLEKNYATAEGGA